MSKEKQEQLKSIVHSSEKERSRANGSLEPSLHSQEKLLSGGSVKADSVLKSDYIPAAISGNEVEYKLTLEQLKEQVIQTEVPALGDSPMEDDQD